MRASCSMITRLSRSINLSCVIPIPIPNDLNSLARLHKVSKGDLVPVIEEIGWLAFPAESSESVSLRTINIDEATTFVKCALPVVACALPRVPEQRLEPSAYTIRVHTWHGPRRPLPTMPLATQSDKGMAAFFARLAMVRLYRDGTIKRTITCIVMITTASSAE